MFEGLETYAWATVWKGVNQHIINTDWLGEVDLWIFFSSFNFPVFSNLHLVSSIVVYVKKKIKSGWMFQITLDENLIRPYFILIFQTWIVLHNFRRWIKTREENEWWEFDHYKRRKSTLFVEFCLLTAINCTSRSLSL